MSTFLEIFTLKGKIATNVWKFKLYTLFPWFFPGCAIFVGDFISNLRNTWALIVPCRSAYLLFTFGGFGGTEVKALPRRWMCAALTMSFQKAWKANGSLRRHLPLRPFVLRSVKLKQQAHFPSSPWVHFISWTRFSLSGKPSAVNGLMATNGFEEQWLKWIS